MSARNSAYQDSRRSNNSTGAPNGEKAHRPRMSAQDNIKGQSQFDPKAQRTASPQERPGHKRSLSGSVRPAGSKTSESERRTEKHTVTTRETLISRKRSPDRRHEQTASSDKTRTTDGSKQKGADTRPRPEAPPSGRHMPLDLPL